MRLPAGNLVQRVNFRCEKYSAPLWCIAITIVCLAQKLVESQGHLAQVDRGFHRD